ncbi:hypothetical protein ACH5RR_033448 [Cinchona calisaya]|uniref:Uncharacterized protein n=1 Tax=Cinchona calisaya TaxID=153742 RepID=A0ABD2YMB6_9GENT
MSQSSHKQPSQLQLTNNSQNKQHETTKLHPSNSSSDQAENNNDTCSDQSSYGSSPNENFFFSSSDSNSGYLDCIVPDNCLKPASSRSHDHRECYSNNNNIADQSIHSNLRVLENQSHSQCNLITNNVLPVDSTMDSVSNPGNFLCYEGLNLGFWDNREMNSCELSAVINNPLMAAENGCMESYQSITAATSSASFSSVFPPFGDVVDSEYSLF